VVAKVEFHFGELFPRVGFIVTNFRTSSRAVVRFYNKRGTAEQWIKEGKQAVAMTRLSCHRFRANEVRLWLSVIAYNLGNLWRRLALPAAVANWSLTSLQQRLVKTGGRLIKHARYYWLLLAESHVWTRPGAQGHHDVKAARFRLQPCIRPLDGGAKRAPGHDGNPHALTWFT
jgi:Transposase DDE domain group 1